MIGGSVDRDENAIVLGKVESIEIEAMQKLLPRISKAFRFPGKFPGKRAFRGIFSLAALIVFYIVNLVVLLIFPRAINRITEKIQQNVWASVGFGLGLEILYIPLIILFAVSVIGIPLIPIFVLAVFVGILFGFSSLAIIIGERVAKGFNWKVENRVGIFSLGWITIMILPLLGLILRDLGFIGTLTFAIGMVVLYVTMTIGLGGVVYALVKRKQKVSKK
jgi:hypothetical protein